MSMATSPLLAAGILTDPDAGKASGTGLWSHGGTIFYPSPLVSRASRILSPRPPARTPPVCAPYAPFLGRFPGTGAFVSLGLPRSRAGLLG